jgi:hypothetical protein
MIVFVTDESNATDASASSARSNASAQPAEDSARGPRPGSRQYGQRNFAERLFPGPSRQIPDHVAARIEGLIKAGGNETAIQTWRERQAANTSTPATVDVSEVTEKLEQQNELLRAILASSVDTQADARSTAQNSRTFAWAGTLIALLTLVATVISIVAAIRA